MGLIPSNGSHVHQELLKACLPCLFAMAILFAAMQGLIRLSGARLCVARLRDIHRCEAGGVQSLSFVLVLPVFLIIVLFIVQVALVMVGLITVNTAAFAAARSASVWIPAYVSEQEPENVLPAGTIIQGLPATIDFATAQNSPKYAKILDAAALACVPIAPSRAVGGGNSAVLNGNGTADALVTMSAVLAPSSAANSVMPQRLRNKLAYSLQNTRVVISFVDKNSGAGSTSVHGPTYNPVDHPTVAYVQSEVGWQDPVTVEVQHHFALLPGPGRFLARMLQRYDDRVDDVAPMIEQESGVHKTWLRGSATLTIEGLKSVYPHAP
ncbi:MAG: pilus assembly protein [Planctomycetaceae bacterium]|nr:pilus assembly protein [Planctomycetaceae bacterium]